MPVEFIEAPYHMGRYDQEVGSGPIRLASTGIAAELGFPRTSIELGESTAVDQVNAALNDEVLRVLRAGGFPLVLAGNCNSAFGTVAALASGEPVGVVWFDAHGDFNTPETSVSGLLEGMSLAIVTEHVAESSVVLAGVRDLDPLERVRVTESVMTFVPSGSLAGIAMPPGSVYVHLDLDVLDPAISPGVNFQSPGGLTVEELEDALGEVFRRADVRALAIANYNPHRDKENRTLHIGGGLIRLICELATRHGLR